MSGRKIDPMDQYRKKEKLNNLKYLLLLLIFVSGTGLSYWIQLSDLIDVGNQSVTGPAKYIFTIIVVLLGWVTLLIATDFLMSIIGFLWLIKAIHPQINLLIQHKLIRQLGLLVLLGFCLRYLPIIVGSKSVEINLFYYKNIYWAEHNLFVLIFGYIWMFFIMIVNLFASGLLIGLLGLYNSEDFVSPD